jgi:plastocyanin
MTARVTISNNKFEPAHVSVRSGETVHWTNSQGSHTVTSNPGPKGCNPASAEAFASPTLSTTAPNNTFEHTFTSPGTFAYHCEVHGCGMNGTVKVT